MDNNYRNLLIYLKNNNYTIIDFKTLLNNNITPTNKFIVLRHDIHARDIPNGYKMINLEKEIYGKCVSTFFVQWKFIGNSLREQQYEQKNSLIYKKFIDYCILNDIDVQPHISVFGTYFTTIYNRNTNKLKEIVSSYPFKNNYIYKNNKIKVISNNIFNVKNIINFIIDELKQYNKKWYKTFNNKPYIYSAHGDGSLLNSYFDSNKFLSLTRIEETLNMLSANSSYFISPNGKFKLIYLTDSYFNTIAFDNQNYQLLIHPFLWEC